ncbi:hypothetical protein [Sutcliffiella rhizosphaerae]|uniref:Uncharacterized protein n=1 Tax=Sutcliffiella rhizosphaerae TaxID=2880967 RepID=A0ABM8YM51_9BACI|nr:hypothetical protein [Sutcliffiella rhizosphaerae]CAG9621025.1 hypothetical protein BACCIP111883_01797 [Sutcliffiella rhizosphaerae]
MNVKDSALQLGKNKWVTGALVGSVAASSALLLKKERRNKVMKFFRRNERDQSEGSEGKVDKES